jgi:hypothetical protein
MPHERPLPATSIRPGPRESWMTPLSGTPAGKTWPWVKVPSKQSSSFRSRERKHENIPFELDVEWRPSRGSHAAVALPPSWALEWPARGAGVDERSRWSGSWLVAGVRAWADSGHRRFRFDF